MLLRRGPLSHCSFSESYAVSNQDHAKAARLVAAIAASAPFQIVRRWRDHRAPATTMTGFDRPGQHEPQGVGHRGRYSWFENKNRNCECSLDVALTVFPSRRASTVASLGCWTAAMRGARLAALIQHEGRALSTRATTRQRSRHVESMCATNFARIREGDGRGSPPPLRLHG